MIPGRYDMTIYKGGTFTTTFSSKNALDVPLNFRDTYDEIRMQIRPTWAKIPYTGSSLMDLTEANGRVIIAVDGLSLILNIDAADTEVIEFNDGKYGLELVKYATVDPVAVEIVDKFMFGLVAVIDEVIT